MKDLLIIAHFTQVPGEQGNGRFHYIAEKIDKNHSKVEIVTSSFSHRTKNQRDMTSEQKSSVSYKLTMLYEPGYEKNVSIKRFYSHYIMGKSLKKYLKNREKPDVIYCSIPSLDVAKVAAEYAKKNNIKFIIDIQDLWPEAFKMVFSIPVLSDMIFWPMKRKANNIYRSANEIVAVSKTYAERAIMVNENCSTSYSVFLGTELSYFDELVKNNQNIEKPEDQLWIVYIGTLGHSYDLNCVIDGLKILHDKGINNLKFLVMGDGPNKFELENYAEKTGVSVDFTGRLDYAKMVGCLSSCDIAVNPIRKGSAGSIINKVGDYAAAGIPVVNTQECLEYRMLVDEFKMGFNSINGDSTDLAEKIEILIKDEKLRKKMGENARRCAEKMFDRSKIYGELTDIICGGKV